MNFKIDPIIPWMPSNIPAPLKSELIRRSQNISFNYIKDNSGNWTDDAGAWKDAKGPMSPWVRFTSNGYGHEKGKYKNKPGFIFSGGKDFYQTYGFMNGKNNTQEGIIGYQADAWATPHIVDNTFSPDNNYPIHVPCPEISNISVTIQKELFRRATISWTCFSKEQLEYMTPYFLVPGISCVLEWGWSHYNPDCLLDVANEDSLKRLMDNPYPLYTDHILKSNGNYDVMMGIVSNFDWSVEGNKIKCTTEITSKDRIYAGLTVTSTCESAEETTDENGNDLPKKEPPKFIMGSLQKFLEDDIKSIITIADKSSDLHMYLIEQEAIAAGLKKNNVTVKTINPLEKINTIELTSNSVPTTNAQPNVNQSFNTSNTIVKSNSYLYDKITSNSQLNNVSRFINYVRKSHPNWKEYVYGIFYGRDIKDENKEAVNSLKKNYANVVDDFDRKSGGGKELWLNFGLVIDILNYHASELHSFGDTETFKISVDDIKITAHKNMISTNGRILLIPNSTAPKYFAGGEAINNSATISTFDTINLTIAQIISANIINNSKFNDASGVLPPPDTNVLLNTTNYPIFVNSELIDKNTKSTVTGKQGKFDASDIKLYLSCGQQRYGKIMRDDLNELINKTRVDNFVTRNCAFPAIGSGNNYDEGYLKDLYVNVDFLISTVKDSDIQTYTDFIDRLLIGISSACGDFWDLRLVSAPGEIGDHPANMRIVDYKYMPAIKGETPYTFKYMSADSILLGMDFKPTISNAQAIRTIYAPTDKKQNNKIRLNNGSNELLDYKFRDRLRVSNNIKEPIINDVPDAGVIQGILKDLQTLKPVDGSYQMTTAFQTRSQIAETERNQEKADEVNQRDGAIVQHGTIVSTIVVRRLALPNPELLNMLLDDGDYENNTGYTGIMPNIQAVFTLQGIGGLRTFQMFLVDDLPGPYSKDDIVFRITNVTETIEGGKWTTSIQAGIIPLRNHIKQKLGIPVVNKTT